MTHPMFQKKRTALPLSTMTGDEFRAALKTLRWSTRYASMAFEVNVQAVRDWSSGWKPIPEKYAEKVKDLLAEMNLTTDKDSLTMDATAFRSALERLNLTQVSAAKLMGIHARTISSWVTGKYGIPPETDLIVRLWLKSVDAFEICCRARGVPNPLGSEAVIRAEAVRQAVATYERNLADPGAAEVRPPSAAPSVSIQATASPAGLPAQAPLTGPAAGRNEQAAQMAYMRAEIERNRAAGPATSAPDETDRPPSVA